MDNHQNIIDKKYQILNTLTDCTTHKCFEALEEAKKLFTENELKIIIKKLNLKL